METIRRMAKQIMPGKAAPPIGNASVLVQADHLEPQTGSRDDPHDRNPVRQIPIDGTLDLLYEVERRGCSRSSFHHLYTLHDTRWGPSKRCREPELTPLQWQII